VKCTPKTAVPVARRNPRGNFVLLMMSNVPRPVTATPQTATITAPNVYDREGTYARSAQRQQWSVIRSFFDRTRGRHTLPSLPTVWIGQGWACDGGSESATARQFNGAFTHSGVLHTIHNSRVAMISLLTCSCRFWRRSRQVIRSH